MAPTSSHVLLPRDDPSLSELFHHFPAKVWLLCKTIIFGLCLILALWGIILAIWGLFYLTGIVITWLRSGNWKDIMEGWRDKVERLRRAERVDRVWKWLERRSTKWKAESVDAEELEHLGSQNGEEGEGSVGGETLFEGEEDEDEDEQARKKEEMELNSEDYMKGNS